MSNMLAELTMEELAELMDRLWRGWDRAGEVYPIVSEDYPVPGVDLTRHFNQNPIVYDLERAYMPVCNEYWGRQLGCRWTACSVCRHKSCAFCPACNPGGIAPNGEAYDDARPECQNCGAPGGVAYESTKTGIRYCSTDCEFAGEGE
jgi:hypothetical protein